MVNILIVDDHSLMRRAVREVIEKESDLSVIAEAANGMEAETQAQRTQPDVILMDLDMPDCSGFEATERVLACSPNSRVVIFSASHQEQYVFQAIQRGAMGYITKDIDPVAWCMPFAVRLATICASQAPLPRKCWLTCAPSGKIRRYMLPKRLLRPLLTGPPAARPLHLDRSWHLWMGSQLLPIRRARLPGGNAKSLI